MAGVRIVMLLSAAAGMFVLAALATLVPISPSGMRSDLGYYTLCPFAPWSTFMLLVGAGVAWVIRGYVKSVK